MRRNFGNNECWLAVISTGRPENVQRMQDQIGQATWYVQQNDAYDVDPKHIRRCSPGVAHARNRALEEAFAHDLICVQLSDDLRGFKFIADDKQEHELGADEAIEVMLDHLTVMPFYLVGLPPTDNPFYASTRITYSTFIVGDCIAVKPSSLRFDEELRTKEDYSFCVSHIKQFGGAMRLNWILASFEHYSNAGGAVDIRTRAIERQSMQRLMETHPGWFTLNKRRSGTEIVMRMPRKMRDSEVME